MTRAGTIRKTLFRDRTNFHWKLFGLGKVDQNFETLKIVIRNLGETIRLRIINGGVSQGLMVSVEKHSMTIVAADGANVKPLNVGAY